jgi:hypothetical protein
MSGQIYNGRPEPEREKVMVIDSEIENELVSIEHHIEGILSETANIDNKLYPILCESQPRNNDQCNKELMKSKMGGRLRVFSYQLYEIKERLKDITQRIQL